MRLAAAAIAGLLLVGGAASAQTISRLGLGLVIGGSPGALDAIVSAPAAAAYSFRKLRAAYGGSAVQLRRTDLATQDIGFTGSGDFDTASATTFCNATSCFVAKWYDQSGNARDAVQATPANQPALVFSCLGALPCMRATAAAQGVSESASTPVLPVSFSAAAVRNAGTGRCFWPLQFNANNSLSAWVTANNWGLAPGGVITPAVDAAWHAAAGVVNGASSVLRVDAVENTGTLTGATTAGGLIVLQGADTTTCSATEVIVWNSYALTPTERTALTANQRAYWGF